ncbi:MAG: O-antigen ligase family protein, partial [Sulfurimonas sp.]|nr:O-antigen ligase family protein [Sulfurimonas sp.]
MIENLRVNIKKVVTDKDSLTLWMNNLLVLYVFLLPISQTIKSTVFSLMVLLFIVRGDVLSHIKGAMKNKIVQAFLYFFIAYLVGMLWSENLSEGFLWVKSVKYGLYLIVFYSIIDGRYIDKVIGAFILGMLVSELVSYGMLFGIMPWNLSIGGINFYEAYTINDPSPFLHHIHYGVALVLVVMMLSQKVIYSKQNIVMKFFMAIFIVTATLNIFVTGGRTGYMTFLLLLSFLSISYLKKYAIELVLAIMLVFSVAYSISPLFKDKVTQTQESISGLFSKEPEFDTSLGIRAGIYYYAFEIVKENPIIGVGSGDSMDEIKKITPQKWNGIHSQPHEHNQFLSVLVKLGIVGLSIFFNIYYQIFRYKQDEKDLRFIMIITTLTIAFGILTTQFNLRFFLPLWVAMLAVSMISRERKTIVNIKLDDNTQLLQIVSAGVFI